MKLHSDLPVYKSCYDLLLEIFLFTKEFTKEYKYTVGESLKKETYSEVKTNETPTANISKLGVNGLIKDSTFNNNLTV